MKELEEDGGREVDVGEEQRMSNYFLKKGPK